LPVGLLLLGRRRPRDVVLAAGAAVAVGLVVTLPWGFGRVWDQYIEYHRNSARTASHAGAARKVVRTLLERDALVVAAGVLALAGAALPRRGDTAQNEAAADAPPVRMSAGLLAAWAGGVVLLLVLEPAFWRPQLAEVIPALALLAALRPLRSSVVLAVVGLAVAPWYLGHARPMLWPGRANTDERAVVAALAELPADAEVITDEPGLAWRAGRRVPGYLVDASIKRIEQGQITTAVIVDAAAEDEVCAVLVWDDRYGNLPGLPAELADEGYAVTARYGGRRVLYERTRCD
ncbi:MAG: hypothetical protein H0V95_12590, partial [Actinobacteria bacterium]|nr:hypothetical protein [Actinomycetota bacterium]